MDSAFFFWALLNNIVDTTSKEKRTFKQDLFPSILLHPSSYLVDENCSIKAPESGIGLTTLICVAAGRVLEGERWTNPFASLTLVVSPVSLILSESPASTPIN